MSLSVDSTMEVCPLHQWEDGGSLPTSTLQKNEWRVWPVSLPRARRMVVDYHYSAGVSNTATYLHGLYRKSDYELAGIAWWIPPTRSAAEKWNGNNWKQVLALSRLVIAPWVPKNAATFLISRSVKIIPAAEWGCLVTYADQWRGHSGAIYRAAGWVYEGLTKPERTYLIDGRMVARKAGPTTRTHQQMMALGAECVGSFSKHRFSLRRHAR